MPKRYLCPKCQYHGRPGWKKRGSTRLDIAGWCLFPLGVPYTLWRIFCQIPVCKQCGHDILIDESSIVGQRLLAQKSGPLPDKPMERF